MSSQENYSLYLDRLESHHVALLGDEADHYCDQSKPTSIINKNNVHSKSNREKALAQEIWKYKGLPFDEEKIKPVETEGESGNENIKLLLVLDVESGGYGIAKFRRIPEALTLPKEKTWIADLSDLSFEEANLSESCKNTTSNYILKLELNGTPIDLFNSPYLLSAACLSASQYLQLFCHLNITACIRLYKTSGTIVLSLYGDDGKDTYFKFAGYLPGYEKIMLKNWYERIVPQICINIPPEVKGFHGI